jgi:four helix bundle protein
LDELILLVMGLLVIGLLGYCCGFFIVNKFKRDNFMADSLRSFQDLECWKAARAIRLFVKDIITVFPKSEQFDLIDNLRRAARSCTRNIAEGYGRFHYQENIQFCRIASGSMTEILDDLITSLDEKYITVEKYNEGLTLIQNGIKILK